MGQKSMALLDQLDLSAWDAENIQIPWNGSGSSARSKRVAVTLIGTIHDLSNFNIQYSLGCHSLSENNAIFDGPTRLTGRGFITLTATPVIRPMQYVRCYRMIPK